MRVKSNTEAVAARALAVASTVVWERTQHHFRAGLRRATLLVKAPGTPYAVLGDRTEKIGLKGTDKEQRALHSGSNPYPNSLSPESGSKTLIIIIPSNLELALMANPNTGLHLHPNLHSICKI